MPFSLSAMEVPIVQAPLAGGPSTPALAAAVSEAGGLGFLAAGYRTADAVRADIAELRGLTSCPFGLNIFVPGPPSGDTEAIGRYAASLAAEAERQGEELGEPRHEDDRWEEKLALACDEGVPVVSFTSGCPRAIEVGRLRDAGCVVWVTVTTAAEAVSAADGGADALIVQGVEAGGHRASFDDAAPGDVALLPLLQLIRAVTDLPLVATGGIATGRGVAAVLAAGASAAQLGSAFMLTPEAGTSEAHREAFGRAAPTAITRAFTGRYARGIENRFMREHEHEAPLGYPEVHNLTAPLRAAARERGDADSFHLWAGQAYPLAERVPAGELVRRLAAEAREALRSAEGLLAHRPEGRRQDP
ncbi:MAG TPA: nitronate monooxygenase [Thermoleophilaceae bacterium]